MYAAVDTATILIVDDNSSTISLLEQLLGAEGYETRPAGDGESGLFAALDHRPDVIILDIGLPGRDGLEVLRALREQGGFAPVLILTGRNSVADKVMGLNAGADDYMTKPFEAAELIARVRALVRRSAMRQRSVPLIVGDLFLDPITREVKRNGRPILLSQREFALLELLMRNAETLLTREAIAARIWNHVPMASHETNIVSVYVAYVRRKLEAAGEIPVLHNIRNRGYVCHFGELDPRKYSEAPRV